MVLVHRHRRVCGRTGFHFQCSFQSGGNAIRGSGVSVAYICMEIAGKESSFDTLEHSATEKRRCMFEPRKFRGPSPLAQHRNMQRYGEYRNMQLLQNLLQCVFRGFFVQNSYRTGTSPSCITSNTNRVWPSCVL